ncbi:hypothetical protein H5410_057908 [Solanum commersonii]|uniref:Uncharacterized protein n=1 Tax=Solanum commersonii TaxID=4109 RepID=A0A9J5WS58_SOLCO|nr:hypothetical protein H5410_057908 [Solanum commersonii]
MGDYVEKLLKKKKKNDILLQRPAAAQSSLTAECSLPPFLRLFSHSPLAHQLTYLPPGLSLMLFAKAKLYGIDCWSLESILLIVVEVNVDCCTISDRLNSNTATTVHSPQVKCPFEFSHGLTGQAASHCLTGDSTHK